MTSGIYEILNTVNGKRYIGSSINISQRWWQHRTDLRRGAHANQKLQNAWNKYGEGAFAFRIILECTPTDDVLLFHEQKLFAEVKPEYNIALIAGSSMRGRTHTADANRKNALAHTGKKMPAVSISNAVRFYTPTTRGRMSASHIGMEHTPEAKEASGKSKRGIPLSPEWCGKLSLAHVGVPWSALRRDRFEARKAAR